MRNKHSGKVSLIVCVFLAVASPAVIAEDALEYRVKAAFLYNFARFIEWPAEAGKDVASPMQVCTFGSDPFGTALNATLKGKTVNGRGLTASNVTSASDAENCEILFVPAQISDTDSRKLLSQVKGKSVLTVGEEQQFNRSGGIVRFLLEDGKVRFEINLGAAKASGLKISSKLLKVAKTIEGNGSS